MTTKVNNRMIDGAPLNVGDFGINPGEDVTTLMNDLGTKATGRKIYFGAGEFIMSAVLWTASNFELDFHPDCVFKLADNADTFAFRLSGCTNFKLSGKLTVDGNKVNNTPGGSSAGAANGTFSFSNSCSNFSIEELQVINGWTNGIALDGCNNFTADTLRANDAERRGITINACNDFIIDKMMSYEATQNTSVYVLGSSKFDISSIIAKGSRASNCVLFETGNTDYHIGSIITDDCFSGTKFENNHRFSVDSVMSLSTTDSIGVTVNGGSDINIGTIVSRNSAAQGVGILSAEAPLSRITIGSINTSLNALQGVIVQSTTNSITGVHIGRVLAASNVGSHFATDGTGGGNPVFSGQIKVGEFIGTGAGSFDFEVIGFTDPTYGIVDINKGVYTTNYSEPLALASNSGSPAISNLLAFNDVTVTNNTSPTTITSFSNWSGYNRSFNILIQDSNTTFANGTGAGALVVQGASVAAVFGELWKATYINNFWYMHKVS